MGTEVKSLRDGGASITDGFCQVNGNEMWLEGIHIAEYGYGTWTNHAARRRRKLLLHRTEINRLGQKLKETGYTVVPLKLYFSNGRAKVEIALATGKREYDKRQALRERQDTLEAHAPCATATLAASAGKSRAEVYSCSERPGFSSEDTSAKGVFYRIIEGTFTP